MVSVDEREKVQEAFVAKMGEWRKRKKMFKELWDLITESLPKDLKEFKVRDLISSPQCWIPQFIMLFRNAFSLTKLAGGVGN